ncbi:hypothetical protein ACLOJK_041849 [Asimina triloba]
MTRNSWQVHKLTVSILPTVNEKFGCNLRVGEKFLDLIPGEVVLASSDGFGKVCDAFEIAGKSILSRSSVVTTGLVSQRYGEQFAHAATVSLDAAGHALGSAWAAFKIRKAINPKSAIKPSYPISPCSWRFGVDLGILCRATPWNPDENLDALVTMEQVRQAVEKLMDEGE